MNLHIDEFIQEIIEHSNANVGEEQKESAEILSKDARIDKWIEVYDKLGDIKLKRLYGVWILILLSFWILYMVVFSFFQLYVTSPISDAVFITLITTTTANIIGLPIIILNHLFPKNKVKE